jgi:hypothetical protein
VPRATDFCRPGLGQNVPLRIHKDRSFRNGDVDLSKDKNGNTNVSLRVEHLAKPTLLTPPANLYVVWFQEPGSDPENEGQLQVGNDLRGQLKTTTPLHNFDIFVTAESDPTVKTPSDQMVLRTTIPE